MNVSKIKLPLTYYFIQKKKINNNLQFKERKNILTQNSNQKIREFYKNISSI